MPIKNPRITTIKKIAKSLESPTSIDSLQKHYQTYYASNDKVLPILDHYITPDEETLKWVRVGGAIAQLRGQNYNKLLTILTMAISSISDPHERLLLTENWINKISSSDGDTIKRESCSRQMVNKRIEKAISHIDKNCQDQILSYQPKKLKDYGISLDGILNPYDDVKRLFHHYFFHQEDTDQIIFLEKVKVVALLGIIRDDRVYDVMVSKYLNLDEHTIVQIEEKFALSRSGVRKRLNKGFEQINRFIAENSLSYGR